MAEAGPDLYLGLISGTSADGIDAALVSFEGSSSAKLLLGRTYPYPDALRTRILALAKSSASIALDDYGHLDVEIGECFASAALALLQEVDIESSAITAIGSHGQTVCHRPTGMFPFTLQIGDPSVIAERIGVTTIADFRRADIAAGGQGAPLLPALHAAVMSDPQIPRAILNLGGIANLTILSPSAAPALPASEGSVEPPTALAHPCAARDVLGFDTGPANCLLDAWAARHLGVARDEGGAWARSGRVDADLLAQWLTEPYFAAAPPKSTGREVFNLDWLDARLDASIAPVDVQATLLALSARSIADALRAHGAGTREVFGCGGGVHNAALMDALRVELADMRVDTTAALGLDPDFVEAAGFAWLARARLANQPGNLPSVTGARGPRMLGAIYASHYRAPHRNA